MCITFCYAQVFFTLRKSSKNVAPDSHQRNVLKVTKADVRLLKMLLTIFITYVSCWSIYVFLIVFDFRDQFPVPVYFLAGMMAHTNSSINSIVYGVMNKNFRDAYKKILSCGKWKPNEVAPDQ